MQIGTKSILFGVHCFFIHPWFVAWSWWTLYGFPVDPRLWMAFFVHDLGYWGKPNMDGKEGKLHSSFGASLMRVFGPGWRNFTLCHSRTTATASGMKFSMLCIADKLAIVITPPWIYLPMGWLTDEIKEYRSLSAIMNPGSKAITAKSNKEWLRELGLCVRLWIDKHNNSRYVDFDMQHRRGD